MWDQIWEIAINHYIFHGVIVIGLVFLIFGPRKFDRFRLGKEGFEWQSANVAACGEMQHRHENQLNKIEQLLEVNAQDRETRKAEVDKKFKEQATGLKEVRCAIEAIEVFSDKISEGTLTNQLFSDELWPFLRLKAFRRLLAKKKNGRIWDKGLKLILEHKEIWLDVLETDLGIQIVDEAFYYGKLAEIKRRVYDDFSEK